MVGVPGTSPQFLAGVVLLGSGGGTLRRSHRRQPAVHHGRARAPRIRYSRAGNRDWPRSLLPEDEGIGVCGAGGRLDSVDSCVVVAAAQFQDERELAFKAVVVDCGGSFADEAIVLLLVV